MKTKFELGEKVFFLLKRSKTIKKECPMCEGERRVFVLGIDRREIIPCPECAGTGIVNFSTIPVWEPVSKPSKIKRIHAWEYFTEEGKKEYSAEYIIDTADDPTILKDAVVAEEDHVFKTFKEAKEASKKINSEQ